MTMGIALANKAGFAATMPTIMQVVVEEDWTMLVESKPMNKPVKGLAVFSIKLSAKPRPRRLKPAEMSFMLRRKQYNERISLANPFSFSPQSFIKTIME
jgi:hypothetical protein